MRPTNPSSTIMGIEHPKKRVLTPQEALRKKCKMNAEQAQAFTTDPHPDLKTMTRAYKAFHLYPDDTRKPTQAEVNDAEKMVLDPKLFKLIDYANTLLTSLKMPSYEDISWTQETSETNFASNLAFTSNEFSNKPHKDDDTSATAFLMLANTRIEDGSISTNNPSHSGFTGPFFVFPIINCHHLRNPRRNFPHTKLSPLSGSPFKSAKAVLMPSSASAMATTTTGYLKKEGVVWHISDHNDIINKIPLPQ
ncbi:hypothetical protein PSTT_12310, partial [Puccinia striiformis]